MDRIIDELWFVSQNMNFHSFWKAFSLIFNKCSNIFWNFYNISCLRFGYLNSDKWLTIRFKKAAIWFLIDWIFCNIWNPYRISSFITRNNYFHKIFRCSALTIYCHILWFNSSCWIFYILGPFYLFLISNGDIMGSQSFTLEQYTHRFLLVPCDIYRYNTFYYREFI